jgi:hypothetical protein
MNLLTRGITATALLSLAGMGYTQDFSSEATFKSLLAPNYYNELFSSWQYGSPLDGQTTWTGVGTTYNAEASLASGLWSLQNALSTNAGNVTLVIDFANSPTQVFAFGGLFQDVDQSGANEGGNVTISFNGGHSMTLTDPTSPTFYGYISSTQLTTATITVSGGTQSTNYQYLADLYVGAPTSTPEPVTLGVLAVSGIALLRRRRK